MNCWSLLDANGKLFAGIEDGVYKLNSTADGWVAVNTGIAAEIVQAFHYAGGITYMGTASDGVWKNATAANEVREISNQPREFSLSQNYPNPFNPETQIQFSVQKAGFTTLGICNTLGQTVATLVQQQTAPGTYSVRWDASSLPSGVYLFRLISGEQTISRKLVLQK